jgi:hypothetical protein
MRRAAWYPKPEATFTDALAGVRRHLWATYATRTSPSPPDALLLANLPIQLLRFLVDAACYAA